MKRGGRLSTFDRMGVRLVWTLGTCIGLMIPLASDIRMTPALALLFPGLLVGVIVARLFGVAAGVLACGLSNGAVYGFLLHGWCRLAAVLRREIPLWFSALANALARHRSRQCAVELRSVAVGRTVRDEKGGPN